MDKRPSQVSFYLAIICLTFSIGLFALVGAVLYRKWTTPVNGGPAPAPEESTQPEVSDDAPVIYSLEDLEPLPGQSMPGGECLAMGAIGGHRDVGEAARQALEADQQAG